METNTQERNRRETTRSRNVRNIPIATPMTGEEEWQALREPIMKGWLTQGPKVAEFEKAFAARHEVKHAIATTNCTTGLHLILAAMEIRPGDEVIVPSFTWVATANVVLYCGAKPVLVDVNPTTFNLDPLKLKQAITSRTRAIIAVHLFGLCADMGAILEIADTIPVIEDAACASGSSYQGRSVGSLGLAAAFSFHPRKSITTGEGGMVTTNDSALAEKMNQLRNHGASLSEEQRHLGPQPYLLSEFNLLGFNYRMTDLQGALGLVQLKKLDAFIEERNRWAQFYFENLKDCSWLHLPWVPQGYKHGWQSFVCMVSSKAPWSRNEIMKKLYEHGIHTRPGTHAVHMLGYYQQKLGYRDDDLPNARDCALQSMAIPLHNKMNAEDFQYVVQTLKQMQ